ncbi:hypothetical protein TPY_2961 [Sulfobacillus acidophilus TPY]|nr:hypothetical protein TPY_2961 [Sulfobacillus acidophilus TPY]
MGRPAAGDDKFPRYPLFFTHPGNLLGYWKFFRGQDSLAF